jgi:hypothetical protein
MDRLDADCEGQESGKRDDRTFSKLVDRHGKGNYTWRSSSNNMHETSRGRMTAFRSGPHRREGLVFRYLPHKVGVVIAL